ncbi:hypothetical protein [Gelidibacter japonicus]|uniref:hypothetical protein n=1 Tax=Gelidibacter japonicus TaxID=1962232 RepID=UPI003A8D1159
MNSGLEFIVFLVVGGLSLYFGYKIARKLLSALCGGIFAASRFTFNHRGEIVSGAVAVGKGSGKLALFAGKCLVKANGLFSSEKLAQFTKRREIKNYLARLENVGDLDPSTQKDCDELRLLFRYFETNSHLLDPGHKLIVLLKHKIDQIEKVTARKSREELETELTATKEQLDSLFDESCSLEEENKALQEKLSAFEILAKGNHDLKENLQEKENALSALEVKVNDIETVKSKNEELESQSQQQSKQISDLENVLAELRSEKENAARTLSLNSFIDVFKDRLDALTSAEFQKSNPNKLLELSVSLNRAFINNGLHPPSEFMEVPEELRHLNATEAIIDHMSQIIQRVKNDDDLDEEQKDLKLQYWQDLCEKQILELIGAQ